MRGVAACLAVAVLTTACSTAVGAPPTPDVAPPERSAIETPPARVPSGAVTVAQPDPVDTWWQAEPEDVAAGDLASLWMLPLFRTDDLGRSVPALAVGHRTSTRGEQWSVEVDLAPGDWSDGRPVTPDDVVATARALATARPAEWGAWQDATVVDDDTVRLVFDRPFAGWTELLSRPPGVLPAAVLADGGLAAYEDELPVTGGWFALTDREPGVSASFAAHAAGPLGAPGLASVEVLVVPSYETALGLLGEDRADVVLGHVVLDAPARRAAVPGTTGAEAFGGTRFELVWPDGAADVDVRRAAAGGLDVAPFVEGLLRDAGRRPGGLTPVLGALARPPSGPASGSVVVQLPRTVEGLGLLARRLQADLTAAGVETSLVRLDPPQHLDPPVATDGHLRLVRVSPRRSMAALAAEVGLDPALGLAADATGLATNDPMGQDAVAPAAIEPLVDVLEADPRVVPLAEVAVSHVWDPTAVDGIRPSGWPGLGLWNVGDWTVPAG